MQLRNRKPAKQAATTPSDTFDSPLPRFGSSLPVWLFTAPDCTKQQRTAPEPYQARNDWLFHFDNEL